jgi:hypothetical protein
LKQRRRRSLPAPKAATAVIRQCIEGPLRATLDDDAGSLVLEWRQEHEAIVDGLHHILELPAAAVQALRAALSSAENPGRLGSDAPDGLRRQAGS